MTKVDEIDSSYNLYINNHRVLKARAPKEWEYSRLWDIKQRLIQMIYYILIVIILFLMN